MGEMADAVYDMLLIVGIVLLLRQPRTFGDVTSAIISHRHYIVLATLHRILTSKHDPPSFRWNVPGYSWT